MGIQKSNIIVELFVTIYRNVVVVLVGMRILKYNIIIEIILTTQQNIVIVFVRLD